MAKPKEDVIDRDDERKKRGSLDDARGPTAERLGMSQRNYAVGDDKRGGKVYHFMDDALSRLYARLVRVSKSESQTDQLGIEYAALRRYERHFVEGGMLGSLGSVDCNRTYSPSPSGRAHLAHTERQLGDRDAYWHARDFTLDHTQGIVVDNVVCHGNSLEVAGYCVGKGSKTRAIKAAEEIIRDAGFALAISWGMVRAK
jgi:hypothetical protein